MAYVAPTTRADGYVVDAAEWNKNTVDNVIALREGGIAIASQAANDLLYASSATQLARLAAGTAGQILQANGVGAAPSWVTPGAVPTVQTTNNTGAQNNVDLTARYTYLRCTGAAPVFSGFTVASAAPQGGDTVVIDCLGTTAKVTHQDTNSTAENRIICASTNGQILGASGRVTLVYDDTTDRWRESLNDPGGPITYTPTWTGSGSNPAIGDGTLQGRYVQRGVLVWLQIKVVAGGTTTFGSGTYEWALPITEAAITELTMTARVLDSGTANYIGYGDVLNTGKIRVFAADPAVQVAQTSPMTWANGDTLLLTGEYRIA